MRTTFLGCILIIFSFVSASVLYPSELREHLSVGITLVALESCIQKFER